MSRSRPGRSLSREEIEAIYGSTAAGVDPVVRKKQSQSAVKGPVEWAVVRVNDDGRSSVVRRGLNSHDAHLQAGYERDWMSERDVAAGWNYVPRQLSQDTRIRSRELGDPADTDSRAGGLSGGNSGVEKRRRLQHGAKLQTDTAFVDRQSQRVSGGFRRRGMQMSCDAALDPRTKSE